MNFAHLVRPTGIVENALGRGGFAGVNMGDDADIAYLRQWLFLCQDAVPRFYHR